MVGSVHTSTTFFITYKARKFLLFTWAPRSYMGFEAKGCCFFIYYIPRQSSPESSIELFICIATYDLRKILRFLIYIFICYVSIFGPFVEEHLNYIRTPLLREFRVCAYVISTFRIFRGNACFNLNVCIPYVY